MKWVEGRSSNPFSPYYKMKLFESKLLKLDSYILKYPKNSYIEFHKDSAPDGYIHHRLNIVIKKAVGGEFRLVSDNETFRESTKYYRYGRFNYFKPSEQEHAVDIIKDGTRYVFSIGWLRKKKI